MKTENIELCITDAYEEDMARAELTELKRLAEIGEKYFESKRVDKERIEMRSGSTLDLQERQTVALERIAERLSK